MRCIKSKATTWHVVDDIAITFHEILDNEHITRAITITPAGTKFHTEAFQEWEGFDSSRYQIRGMYTSNKPILVSIMDDRGKIWTCSDEGVFCEHRYNEMLTKIAEALQKQEALIEVTCEGQTVALLKDKTVVLGCKYLYEGLQEMKMIKMVHHHGNRFIARFSTSNFPESLWPKHLLKETKTIERVYKEICE